MYKATYQKDRVEPKYAFYPNIGELFRYFLVKKFPNIYITLIEYTQDHQMIVPCLLHHPNLHPYISSPRYYV